MRVPFFHSTERQKCLLLEISEWKGTRFWAACGERAKKGVGADCVTFVERVLVNLGAIQPVEWPKYVSAGGGAEMRELLIQAIGGVPEIEAIWRPSDGGQPILEIGDFILRSIGNDYHHLAIYAGNKTFWHMRDRRGLCTANLYDRHATRDLHRVYRVYEPTK